MIHPVLTIPLSRLRPSPRNPRGEVSPESVADLAASLQTHGQLQPLLVRPLRVVGPSEDVAEVAARPDTILEIVAGHRRFAAAGVAGWDGLDCRVQLMNEAEALEAALAENSELLRRPVDALRECDALQALVRMGVDMGGLADRLGRSSRWVQQRLILTTLLPEPRAAMAAGMLPFKGAVALALLPEEDQHRVWAGLKNFGSLSAGRVVEEVRSGGGGAGEMFLKDAPWDLDDHSLAPRGACNTCPVRTSEQIDWTLRVGEAARCMDAACWRRKHAAVLERVKASGGKVKEGYPSINYVPLDEPAVLAPDGARWRPADQLKGLPTWRQLVPPETPVTWIDNYGRATPTYATADIIKSLEAAGRSDEAEKLKPPPRPEGEKKASRIRPTPKQADELLGELLNAAVAAFNNNKPLPWHLLLPNYMPNELADRAARRRGLYEKGKDSWKEIKDCAARLEEGEQIGLLLEAELAGEVHRAVDAWKPSLAEVRRLLAFLEWAGLRPLDGMDPLDLPEDRAAKAAVTAPAEPAAEAVKPALSRRVSPATLPGAEEPAFFVDDGEPDDEDGEQP